MPHVSEFHATGDHDRHDVLLVAALAAGDLSGIDRDHALDLTRSCATCAGLHDDLVAIARATASVPPPVTARPRDFQLTPDDAARLRPGGWRRLIPGFRDARALASRPLGVGLATLGLVGLLVGNAPAFSFGGSAAAPVTTSGSSAGDRITAENPGGAAPAASAAAASAAPPYLQAVPGPSAAASSGTGFGTEIAGGGSPSAGPGTTQDTTVQGASGSPGTLGSGAYDSTGGGKSAASSAAGDASADLTVTSEPEPFRPLNLVFGLAVILGLAILVASRFRSRSTV